VTALAAEAVAKGSPVSQGLTGRLFEPSGSTLEDTILGAWEDLELEGRAACPICHGRLEPAGCETCGSELA
jgi:hypothetical protein